MKKQHNNIRANFVRACKIHVLIGLLFAAQIIAYDAGMLITPEVVLKRWVYTSLLVLTAAVCWYVARRTDAPRVIHNLAWALISADIVIAAFNIYTQRGMASRSIILLVLPILVAATLARKGAIYLTGVLAVTTYIVTSIAYFVINFNEGYKLELYGEIGFYSALLIAISGLAWSAVRTRH